MVCDTRPRDAKQTLSQRKEEVRQAIQNLAKLLANGQLKAVVGPQGAIAFPGWVEGKSALVSDACGYRLVMATGSALAKQAIARAEALAGRGVSREALAQGIHMHGNHWHGGHR